MKLPSNRHLQQIFSCKDFWNTPTAPKHFLPSSPSHHQKNISKKTPKTSPSFKQKHNCRKTFPCLTWSSFFIPRCTELGAPIGCCKGGTYDNEVPASTWSGKPWKPKKSSALFGDSGFLEKNKSDSMIPPKRRVPSKQKCGDKNYFFPVFTVKNTFGVTCFLFFEPIMGFAKLTAHLRCHCCGYIWPEMISGGSFWWMFFFLSEIFDLNSSKKHGTYWRTLQMHVDINIDVS